MKVFVLYPAKFPQESVTVNDSRVKATAPIVENNNKDWALDNISVMILWCKLLKGSVRVKLLKLNTTKFHIRLLAMFGSLYLYTLCVSIQSPHLRESSIVSHARFEWVHNLDIWTETTLNEYNESLHSRSSLSVAPFCHHEWRRHWIQVRPGCKTHCLPSSGATRRGCFPPRRGKNDAHNSINAASNPPH